MQPTTIAPTKVSGRLGNRPKTAAVYALTINSDSWKASSETIDAINIPPTAASTVPTIQAIRLARTGSAPVSPTSARSSTVARISTPVRVRNSRTRSASATATATTIVTA